MSPPNRRLPRKLLVAGAGLAAISFNSGFVCGKVAGFSGTACPPGACGEVPDGGAGDGGSHGVQYCGIPDGGTPVPCDELDAGPDDAGPGDGG